MKKTAATRKKIMDAYIGLMKKQPYDKIKITEISEASGVTRSTFYQYFDGSYELLLVLEEELIQNMHFYISQPGKRPDDLSPYVSIEAWFSYCIKNKEAILTLFGEYGDTYFKTMFHDKICMDINQMMDDEGMPRDLLRKYCVELNFGIYSSLAQFAMETAGVEGAMTPKALAGLANNWRASAIFAEKKSGIPIKDEDFKKIYLT